jgi:Carboxypeptidase regulatory-like domain
MGLLKNSMISKRRKWEVDLIDAGASELIRFSGFVVMFLLVGLARCLGVPAATGIQMPETAWGNARASGGASQITDARLATAQFSASIAVTVRDIHGTAVSGAEVELVGPNNAVNRLATADIKGTITFTELAAGTYQLRIKAVGLASSVSEDVVLGTGEYRALSVTAMEAPATTTTVKVTATLNDVAQEQVAEQEKQRVLGFLPNYYVSYIWDAVPMTPKLKFSLALRAATDPATFLVTAAVAGVEQAHKTFPGYGQELGGYARRYGAAYSDRLVGAMIAHAILPSLLHQDPRYFYRGSGSIRSRIFYALSATVVCRGDNGQLEPNYSAVLGSFAAAGISNLYRAPGDRSAAMTFRNSLIVVGSGAAVNLMREFLSRKVTTNVPAFKNGKP